MISPISGRPNLARLRAGYGWAMIGNLHLNKAWCSKMSSTG